MPKRKAGHQGGGPSRIRRIIDTAIDAGVTYGVHRVLGGGNDNSNNHDQTLDPSHPVEKISHKTTLTKAKKRSFKKKKRFEAKVKDALSTRAPPSTWMETGAIGVITNTGGANVLRYQETFDGGFNSSFMIHPGSDLSLLASGGDTYPFVIHRFLKDSVELNIQNVGNANNRDAYLNKKMRTTAARFSLDLKTANRNMYVDIYTFVANADIKDTAFATPVLTWNQCITANTTGSARWATAGYTSGGSRNTMGATPLDAQNFGHFWKQESKTRFSMNANTNYQWIMPNVRTVTTSWDTCKDLSAMKGKTQAVMIVCYPAITSDLVAGENLLYYAATKMYHYKMIGDGDGPLGSAQAVQTVLLP